MLAAIVVPTVKQNTSLVSQVLNEDGSPAADRLAILYRDQIEVGATVTDAAGIYRFEDLIEGNYNVVVPTQNGLNVSVNYSNVGGTNIENVSLANIVPATFLVNIEDGKSNVSILSGGSGYSKLVPPQVVTDDGYVGLGEVDENGSITALNVNNLGDGTSTTANVYTVPNRIPNFATTIVGTPSDPGGPSTSDPEWQEAYLQTLEYIEAGKQAAIREWESIAAIRGYGTDSFPSWEPGIGITGASWMRPFIQVTDGPGVLGPGELGVVSCVTTYPAGKIQIYANNPSFMGIENSQLVYSGSDYWEFQQWQIEHTDYSSAVSSSGLATSADISPGPVTAGRRIYKFVPEGAVIPPAICGIQTYESYLANKQAFLETVNQTRQKQGTIPIREDLPSSIKDVLDLLGFDDNPAFLSLVRYLNNYTTYSALQRVADIRCTQQIKDAEALYGKNSVEYQNAVKQARIELNQAKGYLSNEFMVKPMLNFFADRSLLNLGVIDALRGLPSESTRNDIVNALSPYITTFVTAQYQIAGSPALGFVVGTAAVIAGGPALTALGVSTLVGTAASLAFSGTQSPAKAVDDIIQQTTGVFSQPSWLSNTSYDTADIFNKLEGLRVNFDNSGGYTTETIPAIQDALRPYTWSTPQNKYVPNPGYVP